MRKVGWGRLAGGYHNPDTSRSCRKARALCLRVKRLNTKKPRPFRLQAFLLLNLPQIDWCWQCLRALRRNDRERRRKVCVRRGASTTLEHLIPVGALSRASRLLKFCLKPCLATETLLQPGLVWLALEPGIWHQKPIKMSSVVLRHSPSSENKHEHI